MPSNEKIPICVINHKGELLSYYRSINECITMNKFPSSSIYHAFEKRRIYRCMLFIRETEYRQHWEAVTTHMLSFKTKKERNRDKANHMLDARKNEEVERKRRERISRTMLRKIESGQLESLLQASKALMKPILCIETGVIYPSVKETARQFGTYDTAIIRAIRKNYKHHGFSFRYAKESIIETTESKPP